MLDFGTFSFVSLSMKRSCMASLTPTVMVIRGLVLHPLFWIVLFSGSYLVCLCVRDCSWNLSWQYVNSMNCIVWLGDGHMGSCIWFGAPITHRMSSLSLVWHWHGFWWHVHWSSQFGIVCSCGWLSRWHALVRVRNLVFLLAFSVWVMRCTALLCLAILSPFRYGCSHVDNRWGHVSRVFLWYSVHVRFLVCERPKYVLSCGCPCIGKIWILTFGWFGYMVILSWIMDEFIHWRKLYPLLSATCDEILSWMIEIWMKIHLVSDFICNTLNLKSPKLLTRNDK